jgi:hypothetical protein
VAQGALCRQRFERTVTYASFFQCKIRLSKPDRESGAQEVKNAERQADLAAAAALSTEYARPISMDAVACAKALDEAKHH